MERQVVAGEHALPERPLLGLHISYRSGGLRPLHYIEWIPEISGTVLAGFKERRHDTAMKLRFDLAFSPRGSPTSKLHRSLGSELTYAVCLSHHRAKISL